MTVRREPAIRTAASKSERDKSSTTAHDVIPQETMKKQTEHNKQKEELE